MVEINMTPIYATFVGVAQPYITNGLLLYSHDVYTISYLLEASGLTIDPEYVMSIIQNIEEYDEVMGLCRFPVEHVREAEALLATIPHASSKVDRVVQLIEGMESSYGLRLLSLTHYCATQCAIKYGVRATIEDIEVYMRESNLTSTSQKHPLAGHIDTAYSRLQSQGWLGNLHL